MNRALFVLALTVALVAISSAQKPWWVTVGLCGSSINEEGAIGLDVSGSIEYGHQLITPRLVAITGGGVREPRENIIDLGLLYGYSNNNNLWFINVTAGLSYVRITKRFNNIILEKNEFRTLYQSEVRHDIGIPWQFQVFSRFSEQSGIGLGLVIGGNVNRYRSASYLAFCLTFGGFTIL